MDEINKLKKEIERLGKEIERLRKKRNHKYFYRNFFLKDLLTPIILVIFGVLCNSQLNRVNNNYKEIELNLQRIDATKNMINELFSDVPERAFIAEKLLSHIIDDSLCNDIKDITYKY